MKANILSIAMICVAQVSFGEDKTSTKATEPNQQFVQMQEELAKAH